jgi:hypothetical protein
MSLALLTLKPVGWLQDQFEQVIVFGGDRDPTAVCPYWQIGALLKTELFGVEMKRLLLIAHPDGDA